jgi:SNF2 family DNA or RNA helicase
MDEGQPMKLRDYQEKAADFLYENNRAMILAPVGAGKTALTLTAMQDMLRYGFVKRWLVLAPKRVCTDVWPVEQPKWATDTPIAVAVGTPVQRNQALHSGFPVVVTNYDNIQWLADQELDFDGIVFDELTKLKNPSGKRYKALAKVVDKINIRWGLTGSFTSNGLEDVFGQCKIVNQDLLGRAKGAFMQQYFVLVNKDFGEWEPRVGSLAQVMARIKPATFLLNAGEYADKLPPCHTVEMKCDLLDRAPYEKMKKDFVIEFKDVEITAVNAGVVTGKLQQMASGFVYKTETTASDTPGKMNVSNTPVWFSSHKFDMLDELIEENQHDNTIIVYNYVEELAELKRRYPHAQTINDSKAIERWNEGKIELLLIHPKSAGHGLNLQHGGNKMVFVSLPWSLELYEQTVGRLHRSGQKHDVWVYLLLTNKTIDLRIWDALKDKRAISDIALEELK